MRKTNWDNTLSRFLGVCLLLLMVGMEARAQKTCVIASAEDHVPIREALIHTNNNHWARTDYRGYWTMRYQFDSATVSKPGFVKTTIYLKNLPDTVFLLPQSHQLGTVEVWGENKPGINALQKQAKEEAKIGGANAPQGVSFDFANMLDARGRRDHKHLKQARKVFSKLDYKDPIVEAYEKATGKKYGGASETADSAQFVPRQPLEEKRATEPNEMLQKRKEEANPLPVGDTVPVDERKNHVRVELNEELGFGR